MTTAAFSASIANTATTYPAADSPSMAVTPFVPKKQIFSVQGTAGDELAVSYDGVHDDLFLLVGGSGPIELRQQCKAGLWVRAVAGNAATVKIAITAETY